ncbi:MAG: hypothetical protein K9I82_01775 [Chitinophagaceae bacterium]|nr:hypothetical protein [Chitinophagaceae bacterium]
MTQSPKEKADELIDKMYYIGRYDEKEDYNPAMAWERAKQCALIAVDEILQIFNNEWTKLDFWTEEINVTINFWQEVKQEIEKL